MVTRSEERSEALGEHSGGVRHLTKVRATELERGRGSAGPGAAIADESKREKQASSVPPGTCEEEEAWLDSAPLPSRDAPERLSKCAGGPSFSLNFFPPLSYTMKCEF